MRDAREMPGEMLGEMLAGPLCRHCRQPLSPALPLAENSPGSSLPPSHWSSTALGGRLQQLPGCPNISRIFSSVSRRSQSVPGPWPRRVSLSPASSDLLSVSSDLIPTSTDLSSPVTSYQPPLTSRQPLVTSQLPPGDLSEASSDL